MFRKFILTLFFATICFSQFLEELSSDHVEFVAWKSQHNKNYDTEEEHNLRLGIYLDNKVTAEKHNSEAKHSYTRGINLFSDQTKEEFGAKYLSKMETPETQKESVTYHKLSVATSVDWRNTYGAVSAVKDQGQCGSCWTFSTTGGLEGICGIESNQSKSFSEQQMIDCCTVGNSAGCNGGLPWYGYEYISQCGVAVEDKYPYAGYDMPCAYDSDDSYNGIGINYHQITAGDCVSLQSVTAEKPVSVAVNAADWSDYTSGVYDDDSCDPNDLDHAVLSIGYGTDSDSGKDYWLVKNSWSASWGEDGYIRVYKSITDISGGMCGICQLNFYASNYAYSSYLISSIAFVSALLSLILM